LSDDRRHPKRPILGVGALIIDGENIVMIQRGKPPNEGWWSLPGGVVEAGEKLEDALRREVREETGLELDAVQFAEVFERIVNDGEYHYVLIDYICRATPGQSPRAGSDSRAARWFHRSELSAMRITEGTLEVIERVLANHAAK